MAEDPPIDDQLGQRISAVQQNLHKIGKTPEGVLALLRAFADNVARGQSETFDLLAAQWSQEQQRTALELAHLCALREAQSGRVAVSTGEIIAIALDLEELADQRRREAHEIIGDMMPDFIRGQKVRKSGAEAHGSRAEKYRRVGEFQKIDRKIRPGLKSKNARSKLIANEYNAAHDQKVSAKTVQRELKKFPVSLAIVELALGRKLD